MMQKSRVRSCSARTVVGASSQNPEAYKMAPIKNVPTEVVVEVAEVEVVEEEAEVEAVVVVVEEFIKHNSQLFVLKIFLVVND